jgi:hypothetical protein
MLIKFLSFSSNKRPLYEISCKSNHNSITFMWCICTFDVHHNVLKYIMVYLESMLYLGHVKYTFCIYFVWAR